VVADKGRGQGIARALVFEISAAASAEIKSPASEETGLVVEQAWEIRGASFPAPQPSPRWRSARAFDRPCVILRSMGRSPVLLVALGDVISLGICSFVEKISVSASLFAFLALFVLVFIIARKLAVTITERYFVHE
jgi:hypothetical protein